MSFDEDDYQPSREIHLVHINVRAETSKVRNQRTVITRGGNTLRDYQRELNTQNLIILYFQMTVIHYLLQGNG